jgi:hypothetical protein
MQVGRLFAAHSLCPPLTATACGGRINKSRKIAAAKRCAPVWWCNRTKAGPISIFVEPDLSPIATRAIAAQHMDDRGFDRDLAGRVADFRLFGSPQFAIERRHASLLLECLCLGFPPGHVCPRGPLPLLLSRSFREDRLRRCYSLPLGLGFGFPSRRL